MQGTARDPFDALQLCLDAGEKSVLVTTVAHGASCRQLLTESEPVPPPWASPALAAFQTGTFQRVSPGDGSLVLFEPIFPEPQLIVLGGGHIALSLVDFAARCGFRVTVVDDRPAFANRDRFPLAERVICDHFANCFSRLTFHRSTYVVIITRGHRHDRLCLQEALKRETAYIGQIGSRSRLKTLFDQLREEGADPVRLAAVHAPIGLPIGSVTPSEIAVSILAELISVRRAAGLAGSTGSDSSRKRVSDAPSFERPVLDALLAARSETVALVTIQATGGSAPRKAGARMVVRGNGSIVGSIGGGCCEGAVIRSAIDVIRKGGCLIERISLTADEAEEEGMACGGWMEVRIEPVRRAGPEDQRNEVLGHDEDAACPGCDRAAPGA